MAESTGGGEAVTSSDESLTQKHTASSKNMSQIDFILARTNKTVVNKVSYSNFAKHFPEIRKKDRIQLHAACEKFQKIMAKKFTEGTGQLVEKFNIRDLLAKLENMSSMPTGTDRPVKAWRPSGNPDKDIRRHLMAEKLKMIVHMKSKLVEMKKRRVELNNSNVEKCEKIVKLEQRLDERLLKFEGAATASRQTPVDEIERFISLCSSTTSFKKIKLMKG